MVKTGINGTNIFLNNYVPTYKRRWICFITPFYLYPLGLTYTNYTATEAVTERVFLF